jgi:cytoskeletal protein CcmA (bactofilin family)
MWKREEDPKAAPVAAPPTPPVTTPPVVAPLVSSRERAVLGSSLTLKGEISGAEDLLVQGRIEGRIELADHAVTIGPSGKIAADIFAKTIVAEGEVRGNLFATEQILIRKAGNVHGNLTSPRVVLEDGCRFKGAVEMESPAGRKSPVAAPRPEPEARPAAASPSVAHAGAVAAAPAAAPAAKS